MTREEHLEFCKKRAREYLDQGDWQNAYASMGSDLNKHPETAGHRGISLGAGLLMIGAINDVDRMRKFIEGFN